jgi:hypothetical protein
MIRAMTGPSRFLIPVSKKSIACSTGFDHDPRSASIPFL